MIIKEITVKDMLQMKPSRLAVLVIEHVLNLSVVIEVLEANGQEEKLIDVNRALIIYQEGQMINQRFELFKRSAV